MVVCLARLDGPGLQAHGGRLTTTARASRTGPITCWEDLLRATGTATARELAVWGDDQTGVDCWIDATDDSVVCVVIDRSGTGCAYPFQLEEFLETATDRDLD